MIPIALAKKEAATTGVNGSNHKRRNKVMEKLSEKQSPNYKEMKKTLANLGNALIQAELASDITIRLYESIEDFTFRCGKFEYNINAANPYDAESYYAFVASIEEYMKEMIKDYEDRIFELEYAKAIMEVYFTEKNK